MDTFKDVIEQLENEDTLEAWVSDKCRQWRNHYEANYQEKHEEYYRLWRGIWDAKDSVRKSERSRIITPALQQAVESNVAELEEATFGRGKWFDIKDDAADEDKTDIQTLRTLLQQRFDKTKIRKAVSECLINSAVYGTGIAEIVVEEEKHNYPGTQPIGAELNAIGVYSENRVVVRLRPVSPQNFLVDPVATSVEDALGVIIDEFVSRHHVELLQEKEVYADTYVADAAPDTDLEPDFTLTQPVGDKIRLTKYFGLVPTALLREAELFDGDLSEEGVYTEAIIVIANDGVLLKAEKNPYMMGDRPVVAFPWDVVPGRFWGRGVCEKGYNSQKALDAEIRGRMDALALTIHPMMAMDATRLPRGAKLTVGPGKTLLTNGNPAEVLQPFTFGNVSEITFAQAAALQQMVQQATGAVDSAGIAGQVNGEATAAGISMSLGAIIKRHKRTLINFQESFLIPFVEKAAWRYMQYDPDNFPVDDYNFVASSTLGIIAREYEVTQLTQLLQTMSPDSPLYVALVQSIIENMNLSNREELIEALKQASQPDPAQQQAQQEAQQAQIEFQKSQTTAILAEAEYSQAKSRQAQVEAQLAPQRVEIEKIRAITTNIRKGSDDDNEFTKRLKIAELKLKEKDIDIKAEMARLKSKEQESTSAMYAEMAKRTNNDV
jgi:hypothetical protein